MNPFAPTLILRRLQTALHLAHGMFYSIKKHQLTQLQARLYIFFDRSDMDITHNTDTRLCYKCHTVFLLHRLALSKLSFLSSSFEIGRSWKAARDKGHEWEHWLEVDSWDITSQFFLSLISWWSRSQLEQERQFPHSERCQANTG